MLRRPANANRRAAHGRAIDESPRPQLCAALERHAHGDEFAKIDNLLDRAGNAVRSNARLAAGPRLRLA